MPCYRVCQVQSPPGDYNGMEGMRALWENWDLKILILYILLTQLYLHFYGRIRRKSESVFNIVDVWLLYLFSDLFATIALGKLSKLKVNNDAKEFLKQTNYTKGHYSIPLPTPSSNVTMGKDALRVIWAPLILFYLGGPDTITVLRFEENKLWTRHLSGLGVQGLRTAYALVATLFMPGSIAYLALLLCIPGIIKYGERVWVVWWNSNDDYTGLVPLGSTREIDESRVPQPRARLALLAHSWLHTLRPHVEDYECDARKVKDYECDARKVKDLVRQFRERISTGEAFKLIEIELVLIYEMLFSKVGTIFTLWGSILRFLSFSFLVSLLVVFLRTLTRDKLPEHFKGDDVITIVLLAGAIFLDLAGIVVQLYSDWALIWACNNIDRIKWGANPVLFLHKNIISDRKTWSGVMGQLSLREFCKNYKPTVCNKTWERLFGKEKMLKRYKTHKKLVPHLKEQIFVGLREISSVRRAEWTLLRDDHAQQLQFKYWRNELEFSRSIFIWHVATEVCYWSDPGNVDMKVRTVKMLSDYMMYLLVAKAPSFPFHNICDKIMENRKDMKELFDSYEGVGNKGNTTDTTLANKARIENKGNTTDTTLLNKAGVENKGNTTDPALVNEAKRIVQGMKGDSNSCDWDIMGGVWVEMICYAARKSQVKKHIEDLGHGGEFFTHVWLLLMHLEEKLERSNSSRVDEHDSTLEYSKDNNDEQKDVKDWDLTRFWG